MPEQTAVNHFKEGLMLSDHAYQSTRFSDVNSKTHQADFSVNVGSWNLQDCCVSMATNEKRKIDHANSPYLDYDESSDEYLLRKNKQIDQIIENIKHGDEIICLQEVDFLFPSQFKGKKSPALQALTDAQNELRARLEKELVKAGYKIQLTAQETDGTPNQKMAVIYNANRFEVKRSRGVLPTTMPGRTAQNRALEVSFIEKGTQKPLIVTNLHLSFDKNYKDELEAYQRTLKGKTHVMYGDCNNVQGEHLSTALGSWHTATNFSRDNANQLTIDHAPGIKKAFDRAFGGPSTDHYLAAQHNSWSQEIVIENGHPLSQSVSEGERRISISRVNEYWRRGVDILKELVQQYQSVPKSSPESQKIWTEIEDCISRKNIPDDSVNKILQDAGVRPSTQEQSASPPTPTVSAPPTSSMMTFLSNPKDYGYQAKAQANKIWDEQVKPLLDQGKRVALIYSANDAQARALHQANKNNCSPKGLIQGSNQALLFAELAERITNEGKCEYVHILPIATSKYGGKNTKSGNQVSLQDINRDLQSIAAHKASAWEIRGLGDATGRYLIGGGVSKGWTDQKNVQIIQKQDGSYEQCIKPSTVDPIAMSQAQYVQNHLEIIERQPQEAWPAHLYDLKDKKIEILKRFKDQISAVSNLTELNTLKEAFVRSDNYKILSTGRGFFTRLTGKETTSVQELEKMFQDKETSLKGNKP